MPTEAIARGVPGAVTHYLLEPTLPRAGNWLVTLLIPQMIFWYFLLPFALVGVGAGLRWKPWDCCFLVLVLSAWITMGAISNANIGTLIRLRDMVTPIVLLFAAVGLWAFTRGHAGLLPEAPQR